MTMTTVKSDGEGRGLMSHRYKDWIS